MSGSSRLDDCGCCEGLHVETPMEIFNRAGLSAIAYRSGTHAKFRKSMLAELSGAHLPALSGLTSRGSDDFSIALLDAWATVADVLTFYQERIANESYLRTATERLSLLQLSRLIGFELRPGVAASAALAFTLDDAPGAPRQATIDVGVKVSSVPAQNQMPQTFETVEKIEARAEWNALRPSMTQAVVPQLGDTQIYLQGISTNLKPGDALLFVGSERKVESEKWAFRRVTAVITDPATNRTRVQWAQDQFLNDGSTKVTVYALRQRASLFGYNAPHPKSLSDQSRVHYKEDFATDGDWDFSKKSLFDLDSSYPAILDESWLVLAAPDSDIEQGVHLELFKVKQVAEASRADFALTGKTTRILEADNKTPLSTFPYRETAVFAQSEELKIAEEPITAPVENATVVLANPSSGLSRGQRLAASGTDSITGKPLTELVAVNDLDGAILTVTPPLRHSYARESFSLNANVAASTHGETVEEVLGSGDSSQANQRFVLRQPPLTYVSAASASGANSTLHVRVNDILWHEVPVLFGHGPRDRVYVTRIEEDGTTTVQFGDGQTGARLPSGQENVRAIYRKGIGIDGLVSAGQLTALISHPPGVRSVTNPTNATGAQGRQSVDDARRIAPLAVLTLDRVVSLQDYEDFARAFAGIAKALGTRTWTGQASSVFLTVAAENGAQVEQGTALYENLLAAIQAAGDPHAVVRVASPSYRPASFQISGTIKIDPNFEAEKVLNNVRESLRTSFSFEARAFAQPVALGEVMALIQSTVGVIAVDIDTLLRTDGVGGDGTKNPLPSAMPQLGEAGELLAAELLKIDPSSLHDLKVAS